MKPYPSDEESRWAVQSNDGITVGPVKKLNHGSQGEKPAILGPLVECLLPHGE